MNRSLRRCAAAALTLTAIALTGCARDSSDADVRLDPDDPVTVTLWHYYNGSQMAAFDQLVEEFNAGEGRERGIIVHPSSMGTVNDLRTYVVDAVEGNVGASSLPNIFAAYADTAYQIDQMGLATELSAYFTEEELDAYIPGYLAEGRFASDDGLKIFPIAKSTEIFMLNKTDWQPFADATGATTDDLATIEGLVDTARAYYLWTDGLTPDVPDDGRAFFGRDAMANYLYVGARQLGAPIFSNRDGALALTLDEAAARRLWDGYYTPYVNGWFAASGRFRSDDVKLGNVISFVGSSSSASFFPEAVIVSDEEQYPIEVQVLPAPRFAGGEAVAVQQGAGMVVTHTEDARAEYASVQFLKWFTDPVRNSVFSISSGYLPVTRQANDLTFIQQSTGLDGASIGESVAVSIETVASCEMYTPAAFANGAQARDILETTLHDKAAEDRAAVEQLIASGTPHEQAVARYDTDENFADWYEQLIQALQALLA